MPEIITEGGGSDQQLKQNPLKTLKEKFQSLDKTYKAVVLTTGLFVLFATVISTNMLLNTKTHAGGGAIVKRVDINPGLVNLMVGQTQALSALAYDYNDAPMFSGVVYEWSMSSDNSVGTFSKTISDITELTALKAGCGELTVIARDGLGTTTKSTEVVVSDKNFTPSCATPPVEGFGKAAKLDGFSYITANNSSSLQDKLGMTFEAWVKPEAASVSGYIFNQAPADGSPTGDKKGIDLYMSAYKSGSLAGYYNVTYAAHVANGGNGCAYSSVIVQKTLSEDQLLSWQHVAAVIGDDGKLSLFVNGESSGVNSSSVSSVCQSDSDLIIGAKKYNTGQVAGYFQGLIDEARVSSIARYSVNFTPSTSPFVEDKDTQFLWHLDDSFKDSSSFNRDGFSTGQVTFVDSGVGGTSTPTPTKAPTPTPVPSSTPTPTITPKPTPTPSYHVMEVYPQADSYVSSGNPAKNFGSSTQIEADGSPKEIAYLKFKLPDLTGKKLNFAELAIRVPNVSGANSKGTFRLKVAGSNWTETGVNYSNRPSLGAVITSQPTLERQTTYAFPMTSFAQSRSNQTIYLGIDTDSADGAIFVSRENSNSSVKPHIEITYWQ